MIPDTMMDHLEIPLSRACFCIHGNDALREEIVSRAVATIKVRGGRLYRQVDESKFRIRRDLRPYPGVSAAIRRVVFPGVVAEFTFPGNGIEGPDQLPGFDI